MNGLSIFKKKQSADPSIREIPVRDLKQHIVDGFETIRELQTQVQSKDQEIDQLRSIKVEYSATLTLAEEYKRMIDQKDFELQGAREKMDKKDLCIQELQERINTAKIENAALQPDKVRKQAREDFAKEIGNIVCCRKGNLSKAAFVRLVKEAIK